MNALRKQAITCFILCRVLWQGEGFAHTGEPSSVDFIENKGQWPGEIAYRAEVPGGYLYACKNYLVFHFADYAKADAIHHGKIPASDSMIRNHVVKVSFLNAGTKPLTEASGRAPDHVNFFLGNDPSRWAGGVGRFSTIKYVDLYPNIDLELTGSDGGSLKYNFIVHPGGDPAAIQIKYEGHDDIHLSEGSLSVGTSLGRISDQKPYILQDGKKSKAACVYHLDKNVVGFKIGQGVDRKKDFIIDPQIVFASFSGSVSDNWGYTATYDELGNVYSGGIVFYIPPQYLYYGTYIDPNQFTFSTGAYDTVFKGGFSDVVIFKFSPDGRQRLYATYLGGEQAEVPQSMIVDNQNRLIIMGTTGSIHFPTTQNAYDRRFKGGRQAYPPTEIYFPNGSDLFVSCLSSDGTQLSASTYVGGNDLDGISYFNYTDTSDAFYHYGDEYRGEIALDNQNNVYVVSNTRSTNIPVVNAFQSKKAGGQDAFVFKLRQDFQQMIWMSYLGGSNHDGGYGLKLDINNNVYVVGATLSQDFPVTPGVVGAAPFDSLDAYITIIDSSGKKIKRSTYLGTNQYDKGYFIEVDSGGAVYATGQTWGRWPISSVNSGLLYADTGSGQFVEKLSPNLDTVYLSTTWGSRSGKPDLVATGFSVNFCGQIMISGWFGNLKFPIEDLPTPISLPITSDAFQKTTDHYDYYFCSFKKNMAAMDYASYFGGNAAEHVDGGTCRFDRNGVAYQTICGGCGLLISQDQTPTTPANVWAPKKGSENCNMLGVKFDFQYPIANAGPPQSVCNGQKVTLNASGGKTYLWKSEPELVCSTCSTETIFPLSTKYFSLLVDDGYGCKSTDSVLITVLPQPKALFSYTQKRCNSLVSFNDSSTNTNRYHWNFGDSLLTSDTSALVSPSFLFPGDGKYTVQLICNPGEQCKDTATQVLTFKNDLTGAFFTEANLCLGDSVFFKDSTTLSDGSSVAGYNWSVNGNQVSTLSSFKTYFNDTAYHPVRLIVNNAYGCIDSITQKIRMIPLPQANAGENQLLCLNNMLSLTATGGDTYQWKGVDIQGCSTCTTVLVKPAVTTTYYLTASKNGCSNVDSVLVTVVQKTVARFTPVNNGCSYLVRFTDSSLASNEFLWDFGVKGSSSDTSHARNPFYTYPSDGQYTITLVTTLRNICPDTATKSLTLINHPTGADFSFTNPCAGNPVNLNDLTYLSDGSPVSWQWYVNGLFASAKQNTSVVLPNPAGYTIKLKVTNNRGCVDSVSKIATVNPSPQINTGPDLQVCAGNTVQIAATSNGNYAYQWTYYPELSCITCLNPYITPYQTRTYKLSATNSFNCSSSDSLTITYIPRTVPIAGINLVPVRCYKDPVHLSGSLQSYNTYCLGKPNWLWNFGDGTTDTTQNPVHQYTKEGNYDVVLFVTGAEPVTQKVTLLPADSCEKNVWVPNAFTPNDDGHNDVLYVRGLNVKTINFKLYNRWGELIFSAQNLSDGWNGLYKGEKMAPQVFVYDLEATFYDGSTATRKGNVTLIQ